MALLEKHAKGTLEHCKGAPTQAENRKGNTIEQLNVKNIKFFCFVVIRVGRLNQYSGMGGAPSTSTRALSM